MISEYLKTILTSIKQSNPSLSEIARIEIDLPMTEEQLIHPNGLDWTRSDIIEFLTLSGYFRVEEDAKRTLYLQFAHDDAANSKLLVDFTNKERSYSYRVYAKIKSLKEIAEAIVQMSQVGVCVYGAATSFALTRTYLEQWSRRCLDAEAMTAIQHNVNSKLDDRICSIQSIVRHNYIDLVYVFTFVKINTVNLDFPQLGGGTCSINTGM